MISKEAQKKFGDGTTYRAGGKTYKRVSYPGTKRGDNYCARSSGQKQTEKVRVRRKDWGCKGKKSYAGIGAINKVICKNCGWTWNLKDGGNDPYICHKCRFDNKKSYAGIGNPCWKGYEQYGMKIKKGRKVPNCVKKKGLGGVNDKFTFKNFGFGEYEVTGNYKGKKALIEITKQSDNTYTYRSYLNNSYKNDDFGFRLKDIKQMLKSESGRKLLFE